MKKDGSVVFYTIQEKIKVIETGEEKWLSFDMDNFPTTVVPYDIRNEFTACGKCWQEWGYFGVLDINIANLTLQLLKHALNKCIEVEEYRGFGYEKKLYAKRIDYRIVKYEHSKKTTILEN